jgi:IMP dehydrogenase
MVKLIRENLTFNDVLMKPQYSEIRSRSEIDLSVSLSKGLKFKIPVFPSNMKTVMNELVADKMYSLGGLSLLHRFIGIDEQILILKSLRRKYDDAFNFIGASIGVKKDDYENLEKFINLGVKILCIDIAHGDSIQCIEMIKHIHKTFPYVFLIAGCIATEKAACRLWSTGADAVRINLGPGSICTTRIQTGHGVPQFSALLDVHTHRTQCGFHNSGKYIIADGGCSKIGDLVKSLSLADMIMSGNMFAGAEETPGEVLEKNGKFFKRYDGSSTHKTEFIEGVKSLVPVKGKIKDVVNNMLQGIASGCSYSGAHNLKELQERAEFIKITNAGWRESDAHDVLVVPE